MPASHRDVIGWEAEWSASVARDCRGCNMPSESVYDLAVFSKTSGVDSRRVTIELFIVLKLGNYLSNRLNY